MNPVQLIKRLSTKLRDEGAKEVMKIIISRLFPLIIYETYYLYENRNDHYNLQPKLKQTEIIYFYKYEEFEQYQRNHTISLLEFDLSWIKDLMSEGTLPFCAFIDNKLAHITWLAMDDNAKKSVEPWPMDVDWGSEACWGAAQTSPSFRRSGLYSCVHAEISGYLKEKGFKKNKFTIKKKNIASSKAMSQFHPKIFGVGHYIKVLFWQFRITINKREP